MNETIGVGRLFRRRGLGQCGCGNRNCSWRCGEPLDGGDETAQRALVEEHVTRTGSARGTDLLARWAEVRARFVKVIPTEYKRVLEQRAAEASVRHLKLVKG